MEYIDGIAVCNINPPVPYVKDWRLSIRSHAPPPPTPVTRGYCREDNTGRLEWKQLRPIERCLRHPPLLGQDGSFTVDLKIHATLRVGDNHNAQVVVVDIFKTDQNLKGIAEGRRLVAKIYNPLYVDDDDGYINPFRVVDKHYTHETAIYARLSDLQGSRIPKYYGSFSLNIPVDLSTMRSVRLILIELIPGSSMRELVPDTFSQCTRQYLFKSIIDFESLLYARDIVHSDLYPRNVLVADAPGSEKKQVIFIDFGDVRFGHSYSSHNPEIESRYFLGTYISPLLRWHVAHARTYEFDGWVDWDWQPWLEAEYKRTEKSIKPGMRDVFLSDFILENPRRL